MNPKRRKALIELAGNRRLAHAVLFRHRHPQPPAEFHGTTIDAFHSDTPRIVEEAFRGGAKSTLAEEVIALEAGFQEFKNGIVVGASEARAIERLTAVKHEIETNEYFGEVFGYLKGAVWTEHKVELGNGVVLQAYGRGQSLRGAKHLDRRPDFCLIDDLEDDEDVATPEARAKALRWLYRTLLPALDPACRVRYIGNRLDPEAVIVQVANDPAWKHLRFPIMYQHEDGVEHADLPPGRWRSSWPERFPIVRTKATPAKTVVVSELRAEYVRQGILSDFNLEYMCQADTPEDKKFRPEHIRVRPRVRTWEAAYAMYDPARTVGSKAATTGKAVWSWVRNRLVVWDAAARQWLPDEMVTDVFDTHERFGLVLVGVEEDGLNEWIKQPLRHEMARRSMVLPLKAVRAPKGKLDFIGGLQPFFSAGEIEFAQDLPELRQQLLSFPTGRIDAPNALAYALKLRPGAAMYEDFTEANIVEDLGPTRTRPLWLAINATAQWATGALVQYADGIRVAADFVEEGDPGTAGPRLLKAARLEAAANFKIVAPPLHFDHWHNVGLRQALLRVPAEMEVGGTPEDGRGELRRLFREFPRGNPSVLVSSNARWTLNGFAAGYAREVLKGGLIAEHAAPGIYRTLMEGIESFAGRLALRATEDEQEARTRIGRDGRPYVTTMPARR